MKSEDLINQLADKLIEILKSGLMLNADTLHYIDSTFSNPTLGELEELLQDETNCETDSLKELLFFPDESLQLQLEDLLEGRSLQHQNVRKIQSKVGAECFQARIRFSDGRGELVVEVDPFHLGQLIARLNLTRGLNPILNSAITKHVAAVFQTRCKVRLRNRKPIKSENQIGFLQTFFEKLRVADDAFFDYLDFVLDFLEEFKNRPVMYAALMAKKRVYFQSLQKAAKLDIQLAKHNVETLLLRGERVYYIDKADARQKILMIDRISRAVFGKTEFFDLMPMGEQSITLAGKDDIDKFIRSGFTTTQLED